MLLLLAQSRRWKRRWIRNSYPLFYCQHHYRRACCTYPWRCGPLPARCCMDCFPFPSLFPVHLPWKGTACCNVPSGLTCSMWCFCIYLLLFLLRLGLRDAQNSYGCRIARFLLALIQVQVAIRASYCRRRSHLLGINPVLLTCCFPFLAWVRCIFLLTVGKTPPPASFRLRLPSIFLCILDLLNPRLLLLFFFILSPVITVLLSSHIPQSLYFVTCILLRNFLRYLSWLLLFLKRLVVSRLILHVVMYIFFLFQYWTWFIRSSSTVPHSCFHRPSSSSYLFISYLRVGFMYNGPRPVSIVSWHS